MESLRDGHNDTIYVCLMIFSLEPSKIRHIGHIEGSLCFEVTRIAFQRGDLYVGPPTPHESIWWTRYLEMIVNVGKLYFSLPKQTSHGIVHFENIKLHHNNYISYPQPCDRHSIQQTLKNLQLPLNKDILTNKLAIQIQPPSPPCTNARLPRCIPYNHLIGKITPPIYPTFQ